MYGKQNREKTKSSNANARECIHETERGRKKKRCRKKKKGTKLKNYTR